MSAENFYDNLNERLASDAYCLGEDEAEVLDAARELGILRDHEILRDREFTEQEESDYAIEALAQEARTLAGQRIEQEQILEASRSVRAGTNMLFAALRENRVL